MEGRGATPSNLIQANSSRAADVEPPSATQLALKGDHVWAARILGARDAVIESTGITIVDPPVHDLREQAEREARARLGSDRWAQAYAAGRKSSIDALIQDIDSTRR